MPLFLSPDKTQGRRHQTRADKKFHLSPIAGIFLIFMVLLSSFQEIIAFSITPDTSSQKEFAQTDYHPPSLPPTKEAKKFALDVRSRLGAPDFVDVKTRSARTKDKDLFADSSLPLAVFSTDPAGVKVEVSKKTEASDLLSRDAVVVKGIAAAIVGKSPKKVASAGARSGSSGSAEKNDAKSGYARDEEKEHLEPQEVVLMVDSRFKALQDENAEMALKLEVAQRKIEMMRLAFAREKADFISINATSLINPSTTIDDDDIGSINPQSMPETFGNVIRKLAVITVSTKDLSTAYGSANAGDTIELQEDGTEFAPSFSTGSNDGGSAIEILKPLTIKCLDLVNRCKLNGIGSWRVMYISTGTFVTTTLLRLEITGGVSDLKITYK